MRRPEIILLVILLAAPAAAQDSGFKFKLSGHAQFLASSTDDPIFGEHISSDASRLRLTGRMLTGTAVSAEASVDATYLFGSILDSQYFQLTKDLPPQTFYDLDYAWIDEQGRYGTLSVYRAVITVETKKTRLTIGRQRLAYGTALFWSPIDIWNPVSPLSLEPEEKTGVDGVSFAWWPTDALSFTALAAAADEWDETKAAVSGAFRVKSYTFDFLAGKYMKDQIYGLDFVGYVGEAGLRGEFTWTVTDGPREDFPRGVIGMDYAWANSLYVAGEYYHNGGPISINPLDPLSTYENMTGVDTLNRNFLAATMSYDLDPVIKGSLAAIGDIDKGSWMLAPSVVWLFSDEVAISFGGQFFGGARDGEYGAYPDLGWLKFRYDF